MKEIYNPKVSIIIPVYNGSNYLKEAIESALAQTYENLEIVVVNDGSTDDGKTDKICRSYGNRIRYFEKENGGVASALNMAIEKMEGEYFSWLSHDDAYYPEKIEKQISYLSCHDRKKVILYANYELINENSEKISDIKFDHEMLIEKPEYALLRGCINGITLLIPKSAFNEYGKFDLKLKCTQDYDMWRRFMNSYKFVHMNDIFTKTRIHPLQDSNKHPNVLTEGNPLWIGMMEDISKEKKVILEGSEYNFYREMAIHLGRSPYLEAADFAKNKMNKISDSKKEEIEEIKVSVIIPFYNRIPLLLKSLEMVRLQTHKKLEILLINDGSTDDVSLVEEVAKEDSRIKILNAIKNKGAAAARNLGIDHATGEYIAFLDSDDFFLQDKIEEQLKLISLTQYMVSHTSYIRRDKVRDQLVSVGLLTGKVIPEIIASCQIATPTVMVNTKYLKDQHLRFKEDLKIGEDTCFWLELLRNTKLLGIEKAYTVVNVNSGSAVNDLEKQIVGLTNILEFILSDKEYSKYHHEISNLCYRYFQVSEEIISNRENPSYRDFSFWSKKPSNPILKFLYLIKYQGISVTCKKIFNKYIKKLLKR